MYHFYEISPNKEELCSEGTIIKELSCLTHLEVKIEQVSTASQGDSKTSTSSSSPSASKIRSNGLFSPHLNLFWPIYFSACL
jgi:hypothetical protein